MKNLILYVHPNNASFNHAIKEEIVKVLKNKGEEVVVRDLYKENFNPVLSAQDFKTLGEGGVPKDIKEEQDYLKWADRVIIVHPTWWNSTPAMLKGYIDKILLPGFAYVYEPGGPKGLLIDKKCIIFRTLGGDEKTNINDGRKKAYETTVDYGTIGFCGIKIQEIVNFWSAPFISHDERVKYLEIIEKKLK